MKRSFFNFLNLFSLGFLFLSCSTTGIWSTASKSWTANDFSNAIKLSIGEISADKPGGGWSVEREIAEVLPLIFLEHGFVFLPNSEDSEYIVDVCATERDYYDGWKTKKSIAVEVLLWKTCDKNNSDVLLGTDRFNIETPYAAGRTVANGSLGISSSKNLDALLRLSVKNLVKAVGSINAEKTK